MIELTTVHGSAVWVNPAHIVSFEATTWINPAVVATADPGNAAFVPTTRLHMVDGTITVLDPVKEILDAVARHTGQVNQRATFPQKGS